jgi:hypothetical protein
MKHCKMGTTPMIFMDANDGMVRWTIDDMVTQYDNPKGEGYAGEQLHAFAQQFRFAAVNTHNHCRTLRGVDHWQVPQPTYFSPEGASLIDLLFIPMDSMPSVGTCCTLKRSGARLQLIDDRLLRDHIPVLTKFEIALRWAHCHINGNSNYWDFDKIATAFRNGNSIDELSAS